MTKNALRIPFLFFLLALGLWRPFDGGAALAVEIEEIPQEKWKSARFTRREGLILVSFQEREGLALYSLPEKSVLEEFPTEENRLCLSPDGMTAVANVETKNGAELWIYGDAAPEGRLLIRPAGDGCDWRPGGNEFAYSCADPLNPEKRGICRYLMDAGKPMVITPEGSADWPKYNPDGRWVVYEDEGKIRMVDAEGKKDPVEITRGLNGSFSRPLWSLDGRRIGFNRNKPGRAAFELSVGDGTLRRIGKWLELASSPRWSSDGLHVAYSDMDRIIVANAKTLETEATGRYKAANTEVSWSPWGPELYYQGIVEGRETPVLMKLKP